MFNIFVISGSTSEYQKKCASLNTHHQCYHVPAQYLGNVPERVYKQMNLRYNIKLLCVNLAYLQGIEPWSNYLINNLL